MTESAISSLKAFKVLASEVFALAHLGRLLVRGGRDVVRSACARGGLPRRGRASRRRTLAVLGFTRMLGPSPRAAAVTLAFVAAMITPLSISPGVVLLRCTRGVTAILRGSAFPSLSV